MPKYNNFTIPTIENDEPAGYQGLNLNLRQGVSDLGSLLLQKRLSEIKYQQELGLAIQSAQAEQQAKFDMQGQQFDRSRQWMQQYPDMFGMQSQQPMQQQAPQQMQQPAPQMRPVPQSSGQSMSMLAPQAYPIQSPSMSGGSMSPVMKQNSPSPFVTVVDPMTGSMKKVANPEYQLFKSQELAKTRAKLQPESADAASAITYRNSLTKNIKEIKDIVSEPGFDWGAFGAWRVSQDNPSFTTFGKNVKQKMGGEYEDKAAGNMIKIHNALQFTKKSAFGEAGKQLTDIEKQLVYSVLQPQGQPVEEWMKNLDKSLAVLSERAKLLTRNKENLDTEISQTYDVNLDKQVNDMLDQLGVE